MQHTRGLLAVLVLAASTSGVPSTSLATSGDIRMDERSWPRGSIPSLTFTVTSGRGFPEKVVAFLYTSERPNAFVTAQYAPQFVGVFVAAGSITVDVERPPERGPVILEHSRERFVQGALFSAVTGALVDVTNEDYLDIDYDAAPTLLTFDFETEDDFATPLANGQDLTTPPEFGRIFALSTRQPTSGPQHQGAAVFDTDPLGPNASSSDQDLLVDLGNALILQENPGQTVPGFFDLPDDAANGGSIIFDFSPLAFIEKAEPVAIDLIDVDSAGGGVKIFLTDVLGRGRIFSVPNGWTEDINVDGPPGYRTLDLTTLAPQPGFASTATATSHPDFLPGEVVRMEVVLLGSGAIDNLVLAREADPLMAFPTPPRTRRR
jgi:hypothetical protein